VIYWDWNVWPALLDLHLCRGLFRMMAFKRSRSPTIFVPSMVKNPALGRERLF
jgi:hypothetical protein